MFILKLKWVKDGDSHGLESLAVMLAILHVVAITPTYGAVPEIICYWFL